MQQSKQEPVARLHIRMGENYLECDIDVLDGTQLQASDSPVDVYLAAPLPLGKYCQHRLVDARNAVIQSGYMCIDCGAVFRAADHSSAVPNTTKESK